MSALQLERVHASAFATGKKLLGMMIVVKGHLSQVRDKKLMDIFTYFEDGTHLNPEESKKGLQHYVDADHSDHSNCPLSESLKFH